MDDEGIEARAVLRLEDAGDGDAVEGVRPEPVDRLGGLRLFLVGTVAYSAGALILLAVGVERETPIVALLAARILQGIGIAIVIPAALALVPRLVSRERQGFGLSLIGSAHNLTQGLLPPL